MATVPAVGCRSAGPKFLGHAFKLALADGGQVLAVRCGGRFLVEEDGHAVALGHGLAYFAGEGDGVVHRHAADGDEGHHVYGTHARMLSGVMVEVDDADGHSDGFQHGVAQRFRFANDGHHQAVVVFVVAVIQQFHALLSAEGGNNLVYLLQVASLAEIGDTFDDSVHTCKVSS